MEPDEPFDYDAELCRYQQRLWTAIDVARDDHVLDLGCGAGLTTREVAAAAELGSALGVDVSAEMVATASRLARERGLRNVHFELGDAQVHPLPERRFTLGISRFGTMFFADPYAAFGNVARALRPGARLVQLVWQDGAQQEWHTAIHRAIVGDDPPAVTAGAFSLADPATAERILTATGFTQIETTDVREPVYYGPDADAACRAALRLSSTRDMLASLDPSRTEYAHKRLRDAFAARHKADGVWLDTRAWIITARRAA